MGYGVALFGGRLTGTPNAGLGLSDGDPRDWRFGWQLTSAAPGDPGFEVPSTRPAASPPTTTAPDTA